MKSIPDRKYTAEFRAEAVKLVLEQGVGQAEAARRLGMSFKTLAHWVMRARHGELAGIGAKATPVTDLQAEVTRLRAENARLKQEKEILKKAAAYFAKESM
jgi:transposase